MSVLVLDRITKSYPRGERPAVHAVSLSVEPGELIALVGESGSGKTTLLRLIAGLEQPDAGTIKLDGRVLACPTASEPPERRGLGLVFQHHALFPHLTVAENIAFGLHRHPRHSRAAVVAGLLDLVNLAGYERRFPHELSGGERQRVALARSLAPAPRALLLDEPFSSLDARLRQEVRDETRAILRRHGATALFVTHDVDDALSIADRIVLLHQGSVQQIGLPRELYATPVNDYVARFFGPCSPWPDAQRPWRRPEELTLHPDGPGFPGTVEQVAFHGSRWDVRVRCRWPDGTDSPVTVRHHGPCLPPPPGASCVVRAILTLDQDCHWRKS